MLSFESFLGFRITCLCTPFLSISYFPGLFGSADRSPQVFRISLIILLRVQIQIQVPFTDWANPEVYVFVSDVCQIKFASEGKGAGTVSVLIWIS